MNANDDFTQRVVMHGDAIEWEDSPMPGVQRRRLDRVQGDFDRVTTIVRCAPNSQFSSVHANLNKIGSVAEANRPGVSSSPLYKDHHEDVRFEHWEPGANVSMATVKGAEVFVIEGGFTYAADELRKHSWLRIPAGRDLNAVAGSDGTTVSIKQNHLHSMI